MAGPYPLATLACTINAAGISAPAYSDILNSLIASYQAIYGSDVVLDPSTQDGQWLAVQAKAINDCNQSTILAYNQASPATAIGVGLSNVVRINGLTREVASNSTAVLTMVGQAGRTVTNGVVGDNLSQNTQWALPATVTFPSGGSINVTATCTTPGAIQMAAGALTVMLTPTAGWQSVTNGSNASPGNPVETDVELQARQAVSTEIPALSIIGSTYGALLNLPGVSQVSYDNNTTGTTDANGVPGHSVGWVIEGGALQSIVDTIGSKKGPGSGTYGSTSGTYTDPTSGVPEAIAYSVAALETISVVVTLHPLANYTTAIGVEIQNAVANYISSLAIGQTVMVSRIYVPAQLFGPFGIAAAASPADAMTFEIVSIAIAISPATPTVSDVTIAWNARATCAVANVTITTI